MNVFISYSSEDRVVAEEIQLALVSDGHVAFFDAQSLPPGGDYRQRIAGAIKQADALVCLISPSSVATDSYALTELNLARKRWPSPKQHVVPVIVREVNWALIPPYLKAVTILEPKGNIAAEVAAAVMNLSDNSGAEQLAVESNRAHSRWIANWRTTLAPSLIALTLGAVAGWYAGRHEVVPPTPIATSDLLRSSGEVGAGADVVFANSTANSIQIVWLDRSGHEVVYQDLVAGGVYSAATYAGHPWLVKDASSQEPLLLVLPKNQKQSAFSIGINPKK